MIATPRFGSETINPRSIPSSFVHTPERSGFITSPRGMAPSLTHARGRLLFRHRDSSLLAHAFKQRLCRRLNLRPLEPPGHEHIRRGMGDEGRADDQGKEVKELVPSCNPRLQDEHPV